MLARHAESLFWAGRYIERAEATARLLDVTYHGQLQATPIEAAAVWKELLVVLGLDAEFQARGETPGAATVGAHLVLDPDNPGSIVSALGRAHENIRSVRELVPTEVWEAINTLHLDLRARDLRRDLDQQPYELYRLVKLRCQTLAGVANETMPRDESWRFLQLGWSLERALMQCRLVDGRYGRGLPPTDFHSWLSTLKSASGAEAYRKVHRSSMDPADVVGFLLVSRTFPRSTLFALRKAEGELARLDTGDVLSRPARLLGRVRADLEFVDVREILASGLHEYLQRLQEAISQVTLAVATQYFRNSQELSIMALGMR
jgi:uncharacterized alpha-E superfamily protein